MTLEDQLVDNLIAKYKDSGKNVQRVLDNPMFQGLPLDKKVKYLETYSSDFGKTPTVTLDSIAGIGKSSLVAGGAASVAYLAPKIIDNLVRSGAAQTSIGEMISGLVQSGVTSRSLGTVAAIGGGLGLTAAALGYLKNQKRDAAVARDVSQNKYLSALVDRSLDGHNSSEAKDIFGKIKTPVSTLGNYFVYKAENH